MLTDRGIDRSQHKYKKTINFDFFDYGPKYNFNEKFKKDEICDVSYKELLQDYKEKVLADVKKYGYIKAAEIWNCSKGMMCSLLKGWGIIIKIKVPQKELENKLIELKDITLVAKYFNRKISYILNLMSEYKMLKKPERLDYEKFKSDPNNINDLVNFYLENGLYKTMDKFNLKESYTIKILKNNKVYGVYKLSKKNKLRLNLKSNGKYDKPYGEVV